MVSPSAAGDCTRRDLDRSRPAVGETEDALGGETLAWTSSGSVPGSDHGYGGVTPTSSSAARSTSAQKAAFTFTSAPEAGSTTAIATGSESKSALSVCSLSSLRRCSSVTSRKTITAPSATGDDASIQDELASVERGHPDAERTSRAVVDRRLTRSLGGVDRVGGAVERARVEHAAAKIDAFGGGEDPAGCRVEGRPAVARQDDAVVDTVENLLELRLDQPLVEAAVTCRPWCDCLPQSVGGPCKGDTTTIGSSRPVRYPSSRAGTIPETGIPTLEKR